MLALPGTGQGEEERWTEVLEEGGSGCAGGASETEVEETASPVALETAPPSVRLLSLSW